MMIEIHTPELEQRVMEQISSGQFQNVDELLIKALDALAEKQPRTRPQAKKNFSQFLLESPLPGSGLKLDREKSYPQPIEL
jgi:Arc/MetJ-type ribon-helix-helix transcriptional regulator